MSQIEEKLRECSPLEVRLRIDNIPNQIEIPTNSATWIVKVDGTKLKSLNQFLISSASRVSECITHQTPSEKAKVLNTGSDLVLRFDKFEGEEVAIWEVRTLKRQDHVERAIALPMNPIFEPYTKEIVRDWEKFGGNPWDISRHHVWSANRIIFDGLYYSIKENFKDLGIHGLRHIRIKELVRKYNFTPLEIQRFVGWTGSAMKGQGINPLMDTYFGLVWQDYFEKLLK